MGTQAVISLVRDGATVVKVVAGCDGQYANEVAGALCSAKTLKPEGIYKIAYAAIGCEDCLVVMGKEQTVFRSGEELEPRYRQTFSDPRFNPRWEHGTAAHVVLIDADTWTIMEETNA